MINSPILRVDVRLKLYTRLHSQAAGRFFTSQELFLTLPNNVIISEGYLIRDGIYRLLYTYISLNDSSWKCSKNVCSDSDRPRLIHFDELKTTTFHDR